MLLFVAGSAPALPPPVPVHVVLFTPGEPPLTQMHARALLERLMAENWIERQPVEHATEAFAKCAPAAGAELDPKCLADALRSLGLGPTGVVLGIHHPGWRGAQHQLVCVGPDPARARSTEVHLRDALSSRADLSSHGQRLVASCLIGALHGPAAERG